jgi:thioredoxin-like negative regulator of GroEL
MKERNQQELRRVIWEGCRLAVFVYTPMCGTCAIAKKMLEIVGHMLQEDIIVQSNINTIPDLVQEYRISSVPALLLFNGESSEPSIIYKMESVQNLLEQIRGVCR